MPNFLKGLKALAETNDQSRSGNRFPAFCPEIRWTEDGETKYIAFLNRAEDMYGVNLHTFVPVATATSKAGKEYTKYEMFIDRRNIGENSDELTDRLGHRPQERWLAVAIELEPTYSTVNGRKRPTGFAVKCETFERNTDNGTEEVTVPVIGMIVQSRRNFYGWLGSFDESTAPVEETAMQVIRRGKDQHTQYDFTPFLDQKIDYTNLFDYAENVRYISEELKDLSLSGTEPLEDALAIGQLFLDKRVAELSDKERYDRLVGPIQVIEDRFGGGDKPAPVVRPSQRQKPAQMTLDEAPAPSNSAKFDKLRAMHEAG